MTMSTLHRFALGAAFSLLSALFSALPLAAQSVTVDTARGPVDVRRNPEKVVVFDLAVLDTLDALDVPVAGVPGTNIPPSLEKYKAEQYVKVGSLFEPDYEAINALQPDLIIVAARSAAKFEALSALAPTIDLTTDPKDYAGSTERNARTLGKIFAKEEEVETRIAALETSIGSLKASAAGIGTGLIVLTTGGKVSAYGPGSRFGQLHAQYGIQPADPDLEVATHGQVTSFEYILETNPDWIFVIDRDAAVGQAGQPAAVLLDNELVAKTKAARNGHIVYLDPVKMYLTTSGLRAEEEIVEEIARAIGAR
jgi:iron complex transport system substrate-binding protein